MEGLIVVPSFGVSLHKPLGKHSFLFSKSLLKALLSIALGLLHSNISEFP